MNALVAHPLLARLASLLPGYAEAGRIHLVGGAVRDALLGRHGADFDFTAEHDPTALAKAFSGRCAGHWFWLDEQRRQSRVVAAEGTFDFAPWRAPSLDGDLAARDFTINTMALDLARPLTGSALIDPLGGRADLAAGILRCAGPKALEDDPLRILKGVRHAVELNLTVDAATKDAMRLQAASLSTVAPERLRLELWRILAAPAAGRGLTLLVECGAGEVLFGSGCRAGLADTQRAMLRVNDLLALLAAGDEYIQGWLDAPVEQGLCRGTLLRWCLTLGTVDAGLPLMLARQWRFSRSACSRVAAVQSLGAQHWLELQHLPRRARPVVLWALQHGPDPVDLLLALGVVGDDEIAVAAGILAPLLGLLAPLPDPGRVSQLVDGHWLRDELGVEGERVGDILAALQSAEIRGEVTGADEARAYLLRRFPKNS